jgi:hypothetical protein
VRRSIEPRTPPSGSYRSWSTFADARLAGRQPRLQADGAFCPRPLSAAPRASRALHHAFPVKGTRGWTSETRFQLRWWAHLFRGEPALVEFFPSSILLVSAGSRRLLAYTPFGPRGPTSASPWTLPPVAGKLFVLFAPSVCPPDQACAQPVPRDQFRFGGRVRNRSLRFPSSPLQRLSTPAVSVARSPAPRPASREVTASSRVLEPDG